MINISKGINFTIALSLFAAVLILIFGLIYTGLFLGNRLKNTLIYIEITQNGSTTSKESVSTVHYEILLSDEWNSLQIPITHEVLMTGNNMVLFANRYAIECEVTVEIPEHSPQSQDCLHKTGAKEKLIFDF